VAVYKKELKTYFYSPLADAPGLKKFITAPAILFTSMPDACKNVYLQLQRKRLLSPVVYL